MSIDTGVQQGSRRTHISTNRVLVLPARIARNMKPNPYVFILGAPRSGTTLLYRMLIKGQPHILGVDPLESQFYSKYSQKPFSVECYINDDFFLKLTTVEEVKMIYARSDGPVSFFRNYLDYCLEKEEKTFFVEKSPPHTLYWKQLVKDFDEPKIILVKRDPRATIHSMVTAKWSTLFVDRLPGRIAQWKLLRYIAALFKYMYYVRDYELIESYQNSIIVHFEEVVSETIDIKATMQRWLDVPLAELFVSRPFSAEVAHKEYKNDTSRLKAYEQKMPRWMQWVIKKLFIPNSVFEKRLAGIIKRRILGTLDYAGRLLVSPRRKVTREVSVTR